ncbi:MAG: hypothetical protein SVY53_03135 [Chloroflexota bacterium]|nr:hypothetical protein [Chloroflexota bacterium]
MGIKNGIVTVSSAALVFLFLITLVGNNTKLIDVAIHPVGASAAVATAHEITLHELECFQTEDSGKDECRLDIITDGSHRPALRKDMGNGETWRLNRSFGFEQLVKVQLYDNDAGSWWDRHDFLGEVGINSRARTNAVAYFTEDGAKYRLSYTVSKLQVDPVDEALARFERSTSSGVWPNIGKMDLIRDIRATVRDPIRQVRQETYPLCGPAAIVFELVSRQPARYVQMCQELYETGSIGEVNEVISASSTLRHSAKPDAISAADWMIMATLRDDANEWFDIDDNSGDFVMGLTTVGEMEEWTTQILGYGNVDYESTYWWGEFDALRKAERVRASGGVAFLMVHSNMLQQPSAIDENSYYPNHWVSFLGNSRVLGNAGPVQFDCYTWGKKLHVNADEDSFENCMWGVVTGLPA